MNFTGVHRVLGGARDAVRPGRVRFAFSTPRTSETRGFLNVCFSCAPRPHRALRFFHVGHPDVFSARARAGFRSGAAAPTPRGAVAPTPRGGRADAAGQSRRRRGPGASTPRRDRRRRARSQVNAKDAANPWVGIRWKDGNRWIVLEEGAP